MTDKERIAELEAEVAAMRRQMVPPQLAGYVEDNPTLSQICDTSAGMMVNGVFVRNPYKGLSEDECKALSEKLCGVLRDD